MIFNSIELEKVQNLASNVIEKNIDPSMLAEIKERDKNPLFELYRIAHTGISKTTFVVTGKKLLKWFSDTVKAIHNRIKIGTKVFLGHVQNTNDHNGRDEIGRIVGKFLEAIGGEVDSYGIVYRIPEYRHIETDIASYEGNIDIPLPEKLSEGVSILRPEQIGDVTGLILAQSEKDTPAFDRARKEGSLQFAVQNLVEKEQKMLTKEEIAQAIKEKGFKIGDFFTTEEILSHPDVKKALSEDEGKQNLFNENRRLKDELHEARADLNLVKDKNEKLKTDIESKKSEILKLNSADKIKSLVEERELSTNRLKLVNKRLKDFTPSGTSHKIEKEINEAIDAALSEYDEGVKDGLYVDDSKKPKTEPKKEQGKEKEEPEKKGTIDNPYKKEDGFKGLDMSKDAKEGFDIIFGKNKKENPDENPEN